MTIYSASIPAAALRTQPCLSLEHRSVPLHDIYPTILYYYASQEVAVTRCVGRSFSELVASSNVCHNSLEGAVANCWCMMQLLQ